MKNLTAIAASAGMVILAAFGSGALLLWNTSSAAAPAPAPEGSAEVVVEFVDASSQPEVAVDEFTAVNSEPTIPMQVQSEAEEDEYDDHGHGEDDEEYDAGDHEEYDDHDVDAGDHAEYDDHDDAGEHEEGEHHD